MKKFGSVLQLACASTPAMLALCLIPVSLLQAIGFALSTGRHILLEDVMEGSCVGLLFKWGLVALSALLMLSMSGVQGSHVEYSLKRLGMSHKQTVIPFSLASMMTLAIYWALQSVWMVVLCLLYLWRADPAYLSEQTVMLAFYRTEFLHSLVPMWDLAANLSNIVWLVTMGIACALFSYHMRCGRKSLVALYLIGMLFVMMGLEMGYDIFRYVLSCYNIFAIGWSLWGLWRFKHEEES